MHLNIMTAPLGCDAIDQNLIIDPAKPRSRYQPFVNQDNYVKIIDDLVPAFLCTVQPKFRRYIQYPAPFSQIYLRGAVRRRLMLWPSFVSHPNKKRGILVHTGQMPGRNAHVRALAA